MISPALLATHSTAFWPFALARLSLSYLSLVALPLSPGYDNTGNFAPNVVSVRGGRSPRAASVWRSPSPDPSAARPGPFVGRRIPASSGTRSVRHAKLPHHLGHGLPSSQLDLGLADSPDDPLRRELLSSWHLSPSFGCDHTRILAPRVALLKGRTSAVDVGGVESMRDLCLVAVLHIRNILLRQEALWQSVSFLLSKRRGRNQCLHDGWQQVSSRQVNYANAFNQERWAGKAGA